MHIGSIIGVQFLPFDGDVVLLGVLDACFERPRLLGIAITQTVEEQCKT
jgi:hypothetical protein